MQKKELLEVLEHVDPAILNYQEWLNVGMALKEEGYTAADWDAWSARDARRYHPGECCKKWGGFTGTPSGAPVTGGTIVQYAQNQGYIPPKMQEPGFELAWDAEIGGGARDSDVIIDTNWLEGKDVPPPPRRWTKQEQVRQLIAYLRTVYEPEEYVGYVVQSYEKDGRYVPTNKGSYSRTAGQLIDELSACEGDMGKVLGDYDPKAGAWIRFNPMDGKGINNTNVTAHRFALVESDSTEVEKQFAILHDLELPIAMLVHSGRKSLHAIVRIDAGSYEEYRKRVDHLYAVCARNGLQIDTQNRNPSRLSRMPGVNRDGKPQYIIAQDMGKGSYEEWREWIESVNDDLPDPESMADAWDNLPELAAPLIGGVLRQGHKMLLAGPSKAGKSFALIQLCIAIAEGKPWFGWPCAQGRVMYVNLELDRASCLHRFKDVYEALGYPPQSLTNIDIWNLRGNAIPMDKLAPKLIRRAAKKGYTAIIIDPIYKVITGDENSADQMANFCNQFDKVCTNLGCAVIYCHHHSKGGQAGKRSMDRASGSGVFARDPDALLDMIELEVTDELRKAQGDKAECDAWEEVFCRYAPGWEDNVSLDDRCSAACMREHAKALLTREQEREGLGMVAQQRMRSDKRTAWRIDGTLREFERFSALNLWFDYPVHVADEVGVLKAVDAEGAQMYPRYGKKKGSGTKKKEKDQAQSRDQIILSAIETCNFGEAPTVKQIQAATDIPERSIRDVLKRNGYKPDKNNGGKVVKEETVNEKC